jgi:hypothetical protein
VRPQRAPVEVVEVLSEVRFPNGRQITVRAIRHQDGGPTLCEVATASAGLPPFKVWLPRRCIEDVIAGLSKFLTSDWRQE